MTTQQLELAYHDRHQGQDANLAAGSKPHRDDRHRVETAVATLANSGASFTADDVHRLIRHDNTTAYDANLVSSVIGVWAASGRIHRIADAYATSNRRTRRAARNAVWRGTGANVRSAASRAGRPR